MDGQLAIDNLSPILNGAGVSILLMLGAYASYRKLTKPTARKARRNIKQLVGYVESVSGGMMQSAKPLSAYTLQDVSIVIDNQELKWGEKK